MVQHLMKVVLIFSWTLARCSDPPPLVMPGHVTIGVLAKLRQSTVKDSNENECHGPLNGWALQEVASLEWALSTINNQSSTDLTIGMKLYDNCGDEDRLLRQATTLFQDNKISDAPLLGVIALGSPSLSESAVSYLHAYSVALLTTHSPTGQKIINSNNVFTTAPHLFAQIQAVISTIKRQRSYSNIFDQEHRLGVISECEHALKIFENQSRKAALEIHSNLLVDPSEEAHLPEKTLGFIKSQITTISYDSSENEGANLKRRNLEVTICVENGTCANATGFQGTIVVFLESQRINALADGMYGQLLKRSQTHWVFGLLDGESAEGELNVQKMNDVFPGALVIEPYSPVLPGLNHHMVNALKGNHSIVSPLLPLLKSNLCSLNSLSGTVVDNKCSPGFKNDGNGNGPLLSGSRATSAVKAVSSLAAAFRMVQIDRCPGKEGICPQALAENINRDMLKGLMKLSYSPQGDSDKIRYTADGRLVTSFVISRVTSYGLSQVGKYREDNGVVWTHPLPGMREAEDNLNSYASSSGKETLNMFSNVYQKELPFDYLPFQEDSSDEGMIKEILMTHQDYISRSWAMSVLVISCIGILSALYIGIYVAVRYCDGTIAGPQLFGALLLVGVVLVYASCILYIMPPSSLICRLRTWMPNLALALCFSVLLVKAMQLRALVAVGLGGQVSQMNLYISLIFMMGVEVALTLLSHQDILEDRLKSPLVEMDDSGMRQCRREKVATLITQDYLLVLLIFGVVIGLANRHIQRNHNEGRWLLMVSGVSTPVVLTWTAMSFLAPSCLEPPTTCAACITLSTSILVMVFIPKMKIIAKQATDFKHHRLTSAPSLSTIFTQLDLPPHPLQPPALFCDPPRKQEFVDTATVRTSCYGDVVPTRLYPEDISALRTWRDHLQESPCLPRHSVPPPPPPPIRNPLYYGSSTVCYP